MYAFVSRLYKRLITLLSCSKDFFIHPLPVIIKLLYEWVHMFILYFVKQI